MDESLNSERDYIGLSFMVLTFVRAWDELVVGVRFICWIGEIFVKASRKVGVKGVRDWEIWMYMWEFFRFTIFIEEQYIVIHS